MKIIYVLIGAPGVGKSTFLQKASQEIFNNDNLSHSVVGPDRIRSIVECPLAKPDGTYGISQSNEKFVWGFINDVFERKVNRGELIIVDATHSRESAISNYKKYAERGYRVVAIDFREEATIDEILARNATRGYKFVPEEVVRTIHARTLELIIPKWVQVIKPAEFVGHFNDIKYSFNSFKKMIFVGDVHGCLDELKEVFYQAGIDIDNMTEPDKEIAVVFVGDYYDRGPKIVQTFKYLLKIKSLFFTMFLRGNHEEPLLHYKEFMKDSMVQSKKYFADLLEATNTLLDLNEQILSTHNEFIELNSRKKASILRKIIKFLGLTNRIGIPSDSNIAIIKEHAIPRLKSKIALEKEVAQELQQAIDTLNTISYRDLDAWIESIRGTFIYDVYKESVLKYRLPREIEEDPEYKFKKLKRTSIDTVKTFLLSDIPYTAIREFVQRTQQMFYADFHQWTILATHGGLVDVPTKATPTADMIRGIGSYEDALLVDETFHALNPDVIGIHGHRNMTNIPIESTPGTYNINGDVDLGLRAVVFHRDERSPQLIEVGPTEDTYKFYRKQQLIRAKRFDAHKLTLEEEGRGIITLFQDHEHVNIKKLPDGIAAINFTRKAFEKGIWDSITVKARGLFMAIPDDKNPTESSIVARGYEKFFNLNERNGFRLQDIRELAYPIQAFEKANGYLGLLSVHQTTDGPQWFISSKSTTEGDFAENFKRMITPNLCDKLMQKIQKDKITLVFEVIDPVFDPHMQEYDHEELILLDGVLNQLNFETISPEDREEYVELLTSSDPEACPVRSKKLIKVLETFNDFFILISDAQKQKKFSSDGIEGFVFEDASPSKHMFKLKTDWYSFWKYMRTQKQKIGQRVRTKLKRNDSLPVELEVDTIKKLKGYLHTEEQILVFNFMFDWAVTDPESYEKASIIDVRRAFLKQIAEKKAQEDMEP